MRKHLQKAISSITICLTLGHFAQAGIVTNNGAYVVINNSATLVTDGMKNSGTIINNGVIDNKGDWANTGTINVDNLVKFTGTSVQSVNGSTTFETLHLDNATGVGLSSGANVNIKDFLELKTGTFTTTGGTLTFLSTSVTHCAVLDNFSPGFNGTVTGNVTSQRHYNAAVNTYDQHLVSSPVSNANISSYVTPLGTNGQPVTPTSDCDETQLDPASNIGNAFEWDETNVSFCVLEGWVVRSSGTMINGKGYNVALSGSGTLSVTNPANLNATYSQNGLTNSNWSNTSLQAHNFVSGWHLIGNPYQASLDLDYSGGNTDFDNNVLVLNTHGSFAGTYQPVSMSGSDLIAPFQAFMAKKSAVGGSANFTINGSDRSRTSTTFQKTNGEGMNILVEGNGFADITYINFDGNSTNTYDTYYDAYKSPSYLGQPTLYTTINGEWASINTNPSVASAPTIPMGLEPGTNGTFTFTAEVNNLPQGVTATLEDKQLNVFQNLNIDNTYSFNALATDNWDRFNIHFSYITSMDELLPETVAIWNSQMDVMVDASKTSETISVEIYNSLGQLLNSSRINAGERTNINMDGIASGAIIVRAFGSNNTYSKKLVLTK